MRRALEVAKNVAWVVFGGLELAIVYALAGVTMLISVVMIPFGLKALKLALFTLWPIGRAIVREKPATKPLQVAGNVVWLVLAGWWMALGHVLAAVALALTIIGIGRAKTHLQMLPIVLWPFGTDVQDSGEAAAQRKQVMVKVG